MTTLITGAGLIGQLTAAQLAAGGEKVIIADIRHTDAPDGIEVAVCDVTDMPALDELVVRHRVTAIVHTAAMLSTGIRQAPLRGVEVNVMGTANVLEVVRQRALRRVVLASSTTVEYAAFGALPAAPIPEDFPMRSISHRPGNIYAMTKVANEHLGLLYGDLYGVDVVVLRYGAVLGGSGAPTSVPGRLLAWLVAAARAAEPVTLDDPLLAWDGIEEFVDARDCARANLAALAAVTHTQRVYNIAPGTGCTMAEFVAAVRTVHPQLRVTLPPPTGRGFAGFRHIRPAASDVAAATRDLGFRCIHDLGMSVRHWSPP